MGDTWKVAVAFGGAIASYLFGGWSALLQILVALAAFDYVSGFGAAWLEGKLSSAVGARGIAKKVAMFVMVAVAHLMDTAMGQAHLLRDAVIFFYMGNEILSIVENVGRIGLPIPPVVKQAVEVLRKKSTVKQ